MKRNDVSPQAFRHTNQNVDQEKFMNSLIVVPLVLGIFFATWLAASWLDSKYNWQLVSWFEGTTNNPFAKQDKQSNGHDSQYVKQLEERVQVLEKLVTEPAYELNKKINALK